MADAEPLTIVLPEDAADHIRSAVDSGEYATAKEAVLDAVALWSARRGTVPAVDIDRVRRAWDDGVAGGATERYDMSEILAEVRSQSATTSRD